MLPTADELKTILEKELSGISVSQEGGTLFIAPSNLSAVCRYLKDAEPFRMDYLSNLTAVDYPPEHIHVVYHIYSMDKKHGPVILAVKLARNNPVVESLTPIWRSAEFQEREVFDLFGVIFENHPDLRRILMWDGFEGHPMRKDYVVEDQNMPESKIENPEQPDVSKYY